MVPHDLIRLQQSVTRVCRGTLDASTSFASLRISSKDDAQSLRFALCANCRTSFGSWKLCNILQCKLTLLYHRASVEAVTLVRAIMLRTGRSGEGS